VRLARQLRVNRFHPLGGGGEQRRPVAAGGPGERDPRAAALNAGVIEFPERRRRRDREQVLGRVERARVEFHLRCGKRAPATLRRVRAQFGRPLEEYRSAATPPRERARVAERSSSAATRSSRPATAWA
jgi:hypothetical protein